MVGLQAAARARHRGLEESHSVKWNSQSHFLSSTKMVSTSSSASSECVTGGRNRVSPVFNSVILVLPSGMVYLTLPPFRTYTTDEGCECIGVLSPCFGEYSNTRTLSSSASTF